MNSAGGRGATLVATGVAVACFAFALKRGADARPPDRQVVIRLVDAAMAPRSRVLARHEMPAALARDPALFTDDLPASLEPAWWYTADPAAAGAQPAYRHPLVVTRNPGGSAFVQIEGGRGALVRVVPVEPGQLLELAAHARVHRSGPEPAGLGQCQLVAVPLNQDVDLGALLQDRSLEAVWSDPAREFLCLGKPPPTYNTDPFENSTVFRQHSTVFQVPRDARALLVALWAGDGNAEAVHVRKVRVTPISARRLAATAPPVEQGGELQRPDSLGPIPPAKTADASHVSPRHDPRDPSNHGILRLPMTRDREDLEPTVRATLRRIDCLGERRDGFLLPPPAEISFELDLPVGPVLLEFGRAVLYEKRPSWRRHACRLEVRIGPADEDDPTLLHEEELTEDDPTGWLDRQLDVSFWAGRRVRLAFATDSMRTEDLVAIGAPLIRRAAPLDPRPNVILVSVDTLRADRLGVSGYPRPTTPHLDALARHNLWFHRAHSTSSYTLPAHASMMTAQLPSLHGAVSAIPGYNRLSMNRSETLAERLRDEGYLTAAFTGGNFVGAAHGFSRGFDRYSDVDPLLSDAASWWSVTPVVDDREFNLAHREGRRWDCILDWVRAHRDGRFFLFAHTYHVHEYRPSAEMQRRFVRGGDAADPESFLAWKGDKTRDARTMDPEVLALGSDLYDATLADADAAIGQLIEFLRARRLWYDTLLIVTSDHGEEFLEHGRLGHGRSLDEIQLRVPLIVHLPGDRDGRRVDEEVSLIDLAPTVLDALGLDEMVEGQGRSLLEVAEREGAAGPLFAELTLTAEQHYTAVIEGGMKLWMRGSPAEEPIGSPETRGARTYQIGLREEAGPPRVFDARRDPYETVDLAAREPEKTAQLVESLRRGLEEARKRYDAVGGVDVGGVRELSEAERERLKALDYEAPPRQDDPDAPRTESREDREG